MAEWTCNICATTISSLGGFVKLSQNRYRHVLCHDTLVSEYAVVQHEANLKQSEADVQRAYADREAAAKEAAVKDLLALRTKGKDLWTREDRRRLVEAHMICVHCGLDLAGPGHSGTQPSGSERKHCGPCYMARDFGEKTAAQGAAKSADGIAGVAATLAKAPPPAAVNKPEEKPVADRFNLIEME